MFWLIMLTAAGMYAAAYRVFGLAVRRFLRARLRRPRFGAPPPEWWEIIDRSAPLTRHLTHDQRGRLLEQVQDLVQTRSWHGCNGLELTEEMQVIIAAQACLLTLERGAEPYPKLDEILVYPSTFVPRTNRWDPHRPPDQKVPTLGQAFLQGVVILSWDSVLAGATNQFDGKNVTLHEFAHQLDGEDGTFDGVPLLGPRSAYRTWTSVLEREYRALEQAAAQGRQSTLDAYGATNRAEFFAVATEAFFEKPGQLHRRHPALYDELRQFYRQDPLVAAQDPGGTS